MGEMSHAPGMLGILKTPTARVAILLLLTLFSIGFCPSSNPFAFDDSITTRTFPVSYASARQLEPIIRPLLSPGGNLTVDERTNSIVVRELESQLNAIADTIATLDAEMPSSTFSLNYADANKIAEKITRVLGPTTGIVEPDLRTHTVYVVTTASNLERVKSLIPTWDSPAQQVLIEADILDVSTAKLKELGIDWELRLGFEGSDSEAVFNVDAERASADVNSTGRISIGTPSVRIPAVFDAAGNLITPEQIIPGSDFSANIEALIEDSSTRTLSRPRILAMDGLPARFEVSTLEPYANTRFSERGNALSLDIQFLDIGIILETIPHIGDDANILMEIRPEISTLAREESFNTTIIPDEGGAITNTIRVPVKSQSRANTVVMVRDGQTIAIGGLRTHENTEAIRKVPLLGDIPVLGVPFRNLNQDREKRELIIFITPHITNPSVSSPEVSQLEKVSPSETEE
ncbi:type II secretion system protein GspD [Candidatus Poribacteria bacterium]|nr:type II secretion system protein GspD [Candidatus Poribacteria bacterium]